MTFAELARENEIKLESLARKMDRDAHAIRFQRPQDLGMTAAEVEQVIADIRKEQARNDKTLVHTLGMVVVACAVGTTVLLLVAIVVLKLCFGAQITIEAGD